MKTVNALVVVAHHEEIGFILPVAHEQFHDLVLGATGVLVFVDQDVLELFLIAEQDIGFGFEQPDDPVDHVVEIVPVFLIEQGLVDGEAIDGGFEFFHPLYFILAFYGELMIAFFAFAFVVEAIGFWDHLLDVSVDLLMQPFDFPAFAFDGGEQTG